SGFTVPLRRAWRFQANSCAGCTPAPRASAETLTSGASALATSSALKLSDQRRRSAIGAPSSGAVASSSCKLLGLDPVADIEVSRTYHLDPSKPPPPPPLCGVGSTLTFNWLTVNT